VQQFVAWTHEAKLHAPMRDWKTKEGHYHLLYDQCIAPVKEGRHGRQGKRQNSRHFSAELVKKSLHSTSQSFLTSFKHTARRASEGGGGAYGKGGGVDGTESSSSLVVAPSAATLLPKEVVLLVNVGVDCVLDRGNADESRVGNSRDLFAAIARLASNVCTPGWAMSSGEEAAAFSGSTESAAIAAVVLAALLAAV